LCPVRIKQRQGVDFVEPGENHVTINKLLRHKPRPKNLRPPLRVASASSQEDLLPTVDNLRNFLLRATMECSVSFKSRKKRASPTSDQLFAQSGNPLAIVQSGQSSQLVSDANDMQPVVSLRPDGRRSR